MHDAGQLTNEEFSAAKLRTLGGAPERSAGGGDSDWRSGSWGGPHRRRLIIAGAAALAVVTALAAMTALPRDPEQAGALSDSECVAALEEQYERGAPNAEAYPAVRKRGCGPWLDRLLAGEISEEEYDGTTAAPPMTAPAPVLPSPSPSRSPSPSPSPAVPGDRDKPPGALGLGQAASVDGISVAVTGLDRVTPVSTGGPSQFVYYGVKMSFTNTSQGPQEVLPDAQVRLENPYVATVNPLPFEVKEGKKVPWGAFRPGTSVTGYVVFGLPARHASLEGFGIYYIDPSGREVVWWPGPQAG